MKRYIKIIAVISGIIMFNVGISAVAEAQTDDKGVAKLLKMKEEAKARLEGTTWEIELADMSGSSAKKIKDTIRFKDGKVISDNLKDEGFTATDFTVTLKGEENEIIVWETMQSSEKEGLAFWKGEVRGERVRGVLSRHISERNIKDYSFSGESSGTLETEKAKEAAAETVTEEITEEMQCVESPAAETKETKEEAAEKTAVETKKETEKRQKKKRGWWGQ